jgi:hypothetical protein
MGAQMFVRILICFGLLLPAAALAQTPPRAQTDGIAVLVDRLEAAVAVGDAAAILALASPQAERASLDEFATLLTSPVPTRVVVNERDRGPLDGGALRVIVEIFSERGYEARLGTWRLDAKPGAAESDPWTITAVSRLSVISGLYKLSLDPDKQYDIHNLTVRGPDLALQMSSGTAFVAGTPGGPTAVVLLGKGEMKFAPHDAAEQTQIRIFGGSDTLSQEFDAAFIRVNPGEFPLVFDETAMKARPVVAEEFRRGTAVFDEYIGRTLQLDFSDLSRDRWSLTPTVGDLIAEVRTKKYGTLTYARSNSEPEDVSLFDRKKRKNISVYASQEKLASRGRFYSEDDLVDYDVLAYDIEADVAPERAVIAGVARVKIKVRTGGITSLTLRLAESLAVRGVYSPQFGRLLHLRVIGQNSLIINLPAPLVGGTDMWLEIRYGGRLPSQAFDREAISIGQDLQEPYTPSEARYLYSNRSYWYPQGSFTDYATAKIRITVPAEFDVVASGDPTGPPAPAPGVVDSSQKGRRMFVFDASRPARYLAFVVSRFTPVESKQIKLPSLGGGDAEVSLNVVANPRQAVRVREMLDKSAAVFQFYSSLVGDVPYPSFTLALTESDRPGGHSPPYFAVLNQVMLNSTFVWRNDPVSFDNFPTFFLAHELAHQWWGHAVGWKNYHEQWISEGFAQYFAAMYAEKERPGAVLGNLSRQMRHTAIRSSDQGPVYLGYRLGHIRSDDKVFRAIVYNKGAMVLHMLRRLVGDEQFFAGIRAFYAQWRFQKAGTDDFRVVMERVSGRDLKRFFETWVFGTEIPRVKFGYRVDGQSAKIQFEQRGDAVDVPITVTVEYADGSSEDTVVALSERLTERTLPLKGEVRTIVANGDNAALVEIER